MPVLHIEHLTKDYGHNRGIFDVSFSVEKGEVYGFNILADKPETVAKFFVPKMLSNIKNDVQITWLTNRKAACRFMTEVSVNTG